MSIRRPILPQTPLQWAVLLLLLGCSLLPIIVAPIPGLSDLPNHIARHYVFFHIGEGSPLDHYYEVHWRWIGNLGVDLPVLGLMHFMDVQSATRIIVAFIAPLTIISLLALSRSAHGRVSASAMLAMPLVFHHAYMYGFINYCLSVALAFLVLALYLARPPESWRGWLLYALLAIGVWTAHMGGWSILAVAAGCAELIRIRSMRGLTQAAARLTALATPIIPMLLWRGEAVGGKLFGWTDQNIIWAKALNFILVLKGWSKIPDLMITGTIGLLALLALFWASRRRIDDRLFAAAFGICLMTTLIPTSVMGSWGADFRLAPAGIILFLLSIAPAADPKRERLIFVAGLTLFVVRTVGIAASWHRDGLVLEQRLRIVEDVPYGSRMGFLAVQSRCDYPWVLNPERKLPALALVRRDLYINTLFKVDGADLMTIRQPRDRVRWFDLSEDVDAVCPEGGVDQFALGRRIADMAQDDFGRIWIWGAKVGDIALPRGYRVIRSNGDDILIGR